MFEQHKLKDHNFDVLLEVPGNRAVELNCSPFGP